MNRTKKLFFIVFILAIKNSLFCQAEPELKLVTSPGQFNIQERVLLILDQDFYLAGEHINFFTLAFDAAVKIPADLSAVLYIELFNQDNDVVNSKKILLKNGEGLSHIIIPRQLRTGYYYLRAYTNYMKNFGPGIFFIEKIKVVNPFFPITYQNDETDNLHKGSLEIACEGGKILYGAENKVAFFNSNARNRIYARLYLNDSVIAETETKDGMGVFIFTPVINGKYRIEAVSSNMEKTVTDLKDFARSGVICRLDSVANNRSFIKIISRNYKEFPLSIFVENNGIEYLYGKKLHHAESLLEIQLPAGLNRISVKNNMNEEVSSRFIYIKPEARINISAEIDRQIVAPEDSAVIRIKSNVNGSINYMVALNLGKANTMPSIAGQIESCLYTSSIALYANKMSFDELKYISRDVKKLNDYLLKFSNTENHHAVLEKIEYLPEITRDIISGSVWEKSDGTSAANKIIYQAFVDSICWISQSKTDSLGKFVFSVPFEYQGSELVITVGDTTENYNIRLEHEFYPYFLTVDKENYYPDSSLKEIIELRMLNLQVIDAYSEMHKTSKSSRSSLRFYGYPDEEYQFRDYINLPNLEEFVFEIVKTAHVVRKKKQVGLKVLYGNTYDVIGDNPLIIFDGIPLLNSDKLVFIPTEKLESIRILSNKFFFGSEIFDGVIDITSNSKSFDLADMDRNAMRIQFSPVVTEEEFTVQNIRMPRYHSNIYFNKKISASGDESIKMQLPQNTGSYTLTIFGYLESGEWGYLTLPDAVSIVR